MPGQGTQEAGAVSGYRTSARWISDTSDKLYFTSVNRDFRKVDVCVADTSDGASKALFQERSNVWVDVRPLRTANKDSNSSGGLSATVGAISISSTPTESSRIKSLRGEWMADQIVSLDEKLA